MKWFFKIMFVVDMVLLASVRYVEQIPFLNQPIWDSLIFMEAILSSRVTKVLSLILLVFLIQVILINRMFYKAKNEKNKSIREISNSTFFQNIEYQYIPSYLGISILAFSLSEKLYYLVVLGLFCLFLINTKIVFFSPWLKLIKNFRLYLLSNNNKEELLLLKGDNNEDNFQIENLSQISTDIFIETIK